MEDGWEVMCDEKEKEQEKKEETKELQKPPISQPPPDSPPLNPVRVHTESQKWCVSHTVDGFCVFGEHCRYRHVKSYEDKEHASQYVWRLLQSHPRCMMRYCPRLVSNSDYEKDRRFCQRCRQLSNHPKYELVRIR
jgi:hypothetical protein